MQSLAPSEVIESLRRSIPPVLCRPGCTDCCGAVPWSHLEWQQLPDKFKRKLIANEVMVKSPASGRYRKAIIPLRRQIKGKAVTVLWTVDSWMKFFTARPVKSNKCVFLTEDEFGCTVYQYRPIICRLFATILDERASCPHGCQSIPQLHWDLGTVMSQAWFECMEKD